LKSCLSFFCVVCLIFSISGCATSQDLKQVRGELDQKITIVDQKLMTIDKKTSALKQEVEASTETITSLRKGQANVGADTTEIRKNIQQLKGAVEELRKEIMTVVQRASLTNNVREKLDDISFKINFIESFLGISKKGDIGEVGEKGDIKSVPSKETAKGKTDSESIYAASYEIFKEGKYEKAREEFRNFLKQFPDTEYSDNAQFWIGECYYLEKKYENAILEYDKVVKNYPQGNKVPYALLKQGFCFFELGDKSSAKIILQQVIKDYPNTNQATIARTKLMEIK